MPGPQLTLNEFFIEGGSQEASHVLLHITEPSTPEEKLKGYFFAVCEINNATTEYITKVQDAIDEIERGYYELPDSPTKPALEAILEKVNSRSSALVVPGTDLHCLVGALRQPEIIFSTCGKPTLELFYKTRQGLYRSMNLLAGEEAENKEPAPPQLFSQIVQGKISQNDYLFIATPHVREFFSLDRLEKVITTGSARQSAEHLERVLKELKNEYSYGGLIIHLPSLPAATIKKIRPLGERGSAASLKNLFSTETTTSQTLAPSLFGRVKERILSQTEPAHVANLKHETEEAGPTAPAAEIRSAHTHPYRARQAEEASQKSNFWPLLMAGLKIAGHFLWRALTAFVGIISFVVVQFVRMLGFIGILIFNYQGRRQAVLDDLHRQWRFYKRTVQEMPLITKIIVVAAVLVALVFTISLLYLRAAERRALAAQTYQNTIEQITTKRGSAESALVYKNDSAALAELLEAQKILASLPCRSTAEQKQCGDLAQSLEALLTRARKITIVKPELLATWPSEVKRIFKINNKLVGFGNTSSLYVFDVLSRENKTLPGGPAFGGVKAASVPKENDYAALLINENKLLSFDPNDLSLKPLTVSFGEEKTNIASIVVYNRRLYTLDATHTQLFKHDTIAGGFGPGKQWLREATSSLANGADLTIDGDLFVLTKSGQILKFTAGSSAPFSVSSLDPALTNGEELYTYNDLTYLYALDALGKRLVILEKDGRLKTQVMAPEFKNPTSLAVDEATKTAYLIDQGRLYKISLPI